jgi:hypothetical protein
MPLSSSLAVAVEPGGQVAGEIGKKKGPLQVRGRGGLVMTKRVPRRRGGAEETTEQSAS